ELPEVLHDVQAEAERHEVDEVGVEVVARVREEGRGHEVDERGREVAVQLLAEERHDRTPRRPPGPHAITRRKRSSSVGAATWTSSRPQPRATTAAATARCAGPGSRARTTHRPSPASSTSCTPGSDARTGATSARGPSMP